MLKKILICTAAVLIFASAFSLLSCSDPRSQNEKPSGALSSETDLVSEIREDLPEKNFNGQLFRIACDEGTGAKDDFMAENLDAEILNDAVYNRNLAVEQRFGIILEPVLSGYGESFVKNLNNSILASDNAYDAAMGMNNVYSGITSLVYEGRFTDWKKLQYVDLDKPWWDTNVIRDICFGDKIFCMTGDFNPSTLGNTRIILFNKNLFNDLNIEYPYQKVLDGTWTYDEFSMICAMGNTDLDGDGKINYKNDRFGFIGWYCDVAESIFYGLGGSYTVKDSSNLPYFNLDNPQSIELTDKLIAIFAEGSGGWLNDIGWSIDIEMFDQGRALMLNSRFYLLSNFRNMNDDFGIIPHPKLNKEQPSYLESVDAVCTMCYIPVTNDDLDFTSIILEAMAAQSYRTVMPAYYNVVLQTKLTRDNDSEEMIDIIKNSRSYPLQLKTFTFDFFTPFIKTQSNTLASAYAKRAKAGEKELEVIISAYT